MRTIAIIQARMGSSRLPGKVMSDIAGKTMLERVIERVSASQMVDKVVVATTHASEDDVLIEYLRDSALCDYFRGSVDDVLARFFDCAKFYRADLVVRVTADDPLKDSEIIDKAVNLLCMDPSLDYCSNTLEPSYPEGLDVEVVRFSALHRANAESQLLSEREHVTPYIWKHPELFKILNFKGRRALQDWRWTVDKSEDIEFMRSVFEEFQDQPLVSYRDVIAWLDIHPEVRMINAGTLRNEGYIKSIWNEKL